MIVLDLDDFVQWFGKEQPAVEQAVVKRKIETRRKCGVQFGFGCSLH